MNQKILFKHEMMVEEITLASYFYSTDSINWILTSIKKIKKVFVMDEILMCEMMCHCSNFRISLFPNSINFVLHPISDYFNIYSIFN